jgi:methionyl-tRNA formyltransferase
MGTPEFAVPSLDILIQNGYDVVGVVTATDKWGGRGNKKLIKSAVKKYAEEKGLNILQPEKLKAPKFAAELEALKADLQLVVAFRILPKVVWNMPPMGTFNLHGSLLPKYRGAAPIHWSVINGDTETGVTTFFLKQKVDTGNLLFQSKIDIGENETTGDVYTRLMQVGAELTLKTVQAIEKGNVEPMEQDETLVTKAPKVFHETSEINFEQDTATVHNFIRGLSPIPTAWTTLEGKKLKIFRTTKEIVEHKETVGTFITDNKKFLKVATLDGYVHLHELQLAGKKRMKVRDFLNGFKLSE